MVSRDMETKLIEAQISIAESLKGIQENIKILNDHNILHAAKAESSSNIIIEKLKLLTDKYWWLIIVLIAVILVISGFEKASSLLIGV